ncbi:MAG: aldo/keto reductase [Candidatus Marinimicrobia bacterium]|nr:aldo/keto reductase [Candidatus Neomarinimicrobiota bacterium]
MDRITLGRTNIMVSAISLGTWSYGGPNVSGGQSVGWMGQEDRDSTEALIRAWKLGINHWDTADVYGSGKSEKIIGGIWDIVPRDEIFLATKVGWDKGTYEHFYHPDHMRHQLEQSLKNLKTETIDLYYLHHCLFGKKGEYFNEALEMMHRFKEEGKIRFIGISDWDMGKIMTYAALTNPDVIQAYRNVMDDDYESSGLKAWVDQKNTGVVFFSPIKHGLLTGKYTKPVQFPEGDFRKNIKDFGNKAIIEKMMENRILLEERFSHHSESILHGLVDSLLIDSQTGCVLLGQRNSAQVESAAKVGTPLSQEDADWVKALYRK